MKPTTKELLKSIRQNNKDLMNYIGIKFADLNITKDETLLLIVMINYLIKNLFSSKENSIG